MASLKTMFGPEFASAVAAAVARDSWDAAQWRLYDCLCRRRLIELLLAQGEERILAKLVLIIFAPIPGIGIFIGARLIAANGIN